MESAIETGVETDFESEIESIVHLCSVNPALWQPRSNRGELPKSPTPATLVDAIAETLSWSAKDGAFAVSQHMTGKRTILLVAGTDGVPPEKIPFLQEVLRMLRHIASIPLWDKASGEASDRAVYRFVIKHAKEKVRHRLKKYGDLLKPFFKILLGLPKDSRRRLVHYFGKGVVKRLRAFGRRLLGNKLSLQLLDRLDKSDAVLANFINASKCIPQQSYHLYLLTDLERELNIKADVVNALEKILKIFKAVPLLLEYARSSHFKTMVGKPVWVKCFDPMPAGDFILEGKRGWSSRFESWVKPRTIADVEKSRNMDFADVRIEAIVNALVPGTVDCELVMVWHLQNIRDYVGRGTTYPLGLSRRYCRSCYEIMKQFEWLTFPDKKEDKPSGPRSNGKFHLGWRMPRELLSEIALDKVYRRLQVLLRDGNRETDKFTVRSILPKDFTLLADPTKFIAISNEKAITRREATSRCV